MKHRWQLLQLWRLARSMDEGTPLPSATARRLEADPALRRHRDSLRALERGLQGEARSWRADHGPEVRVPFARRTPADHPRSRMRRLLIPVAAAAALLATLALLTRGTAPATSVPPPAPVVHVGAGSPAPWAAFDRLAGRARELSLAGLRLAPDEALMDEARKTARDARRLAKVLAESVSFTRGHSG